MLSAATGLNTVGTLALTGEGGQYVTFLLGDEEYALEILAVQEIIGFTRITHVPHMPDFIKGVINLRGTVVPVVDLRLKFGLGHADYNSHTCVIVVNMGERTMGMIVDVVSEVVNLPEGSVEPAPPFGANIHADFIKGMGKAGDRLLIILDIEKVLSNEELAAIVNA
jgi:purine-binding chemotaxis protein CheW